MCAQRKIKDVQALRFENLCFFCVINCKVVTFMNCEIKFVIWGICVIIF